MKREEAIGILSARSRILKNSKKTGKQRASEALDMAIEALKRQTPQKPNLEGDGYADGVLVYDTWICPNCEKRYEVDYDEYDYCPHCGQAIDWSEE